MTDSLFNLPLFPEPPEQEKSLDMATQQLSRVVQDCINNFDPVAAQRLLTTEQESVWIKRGEDRALDLFHKAAVHVPAYKDFLKKNGVEPNSIKVIDDFKKIPIIDKENYLRAYPVEALSWYGKIAANQMISVSSGSSGKPFFWPRTQILEAETTLEHELFLSTYFEVDQKSTLFIVCFAMGMYVAGPITMNSVLRMSAKGYPITVMTPGYSPNDVLSIIPALGPKYDQIVLAGYPPYIKEIIDLGVDKGIEWKDIPVRFLLAGEGFNESWRSYVAELAGGQSPVYNFLNLYGSADAAVLAHETTASIIVRRRIAEDINSRIKLFDDERLPSFLQYYPEHKFFEVVNDELIFTAPGGIPLIRYNIHDRGGILTRKQITDTIPELSEYFQQLEVEHKLWNLPFVYVFGKSDQTVILYGANVYPENIKRALEDEDLRDVCSGKIIMYIDVDDNKDQKLCIDVECSPGAKRTKYLGQKIKKRILNTLLKVNSEYRVVHAAIGSRTIPEIHLVAFGDKKFKNGTIKHRWTRPN